MTKAQIEILKHSLNIDLSNYKAELYDKYARIFLEKNSRINLISKNDEKFLFEKHIFDSLAINLFFKNKEDFIKPPSPVGGKKLVVSNNSQTLLDIGTGGGFPAIPIALLYDNLNIYSIDSIRKKIKVIEEIKTELNITNLFPMCDRVENVTQKFDYITTRAVAALDVALKYAIPHLKKGGYFIAYKSKKAIDELKDSGKTIKSLGVKLIDIIEYKLPLEENFERNLIIFKK